MRKTTFANEEYYHIYNRGVDKRDIFMDHDDFQRFLQSMDEFNSIDTIGSIYENSFRKDKDQRGNSVSKAGRLVEFVAYCLNPNHYHFLVKQISDKGIEKFMHKIGLGYSKYFNNKYDRTGVLFQGKFKAKYINSNAYLLHVKAYIDCNYLVHRIPAGKYRSSLIETATNLAFDEKVVLRDFSSKAEYQTFAQKTVKEIVKNRLKKSEYIE